MTHGQCLLEEQLVKILAEYDRCLIQNLTTLLHANNVLRPCIVKNLARELRVTRSDKHKLQRRGRDDFLELVLRYVVGQAVIRLEDKAVALILKDQIVLTDRSEGVDDAVPCKVHPYWVVAHHMLKSLKRPVNPLHSHGVSSLLEAPDCTGELLLIIE